MTINTPTINVMVAAARKAGRALARDLGEVENLQVSIKGAGDFVSAADRKAEEILKRELLHARPAYGWLGEETGEEKGKDDARRWIVDPLDGTTNFLHGMPHFAVSVALEHKGEIVAGVILDPAKDELFVAEKGYGAYLNERRIRVSARRELIESVFATGLPFAAKKTLPLTLKDLMQVLPRTAGVRRWGVASLDLAYVAAGRYEGFWERELQPWDMAAGLVIAREAGALVTDITGGADMLGRGDLVVATPDLHDKLLEMVSHPPAAKPKPAAEPETGSDDAPDADQEQDAAAAPETPPSS